MNFILHAIVFLGSFLLFQIELIAAKALLPTFGGSHLVFAACMAFFQGLLLLGYGWAWLAGLFRAAPHFLVIHVLLLLFPALLFPMDFSPLTPEHAASFASIPWRLFRTLGPAFLMLSSVSVVTQQFAASLAERPLGNGQSRREPYALYATSNWASALALASYPLLVEPFLDLTRQLVLWQVGYALLVLLHCVAGWLFLRPDPTSEGQSSLEPYAAPADAAAPFPQPAVAALPPTVLDRDIAAVPPRPRSARLLLAAGGSALFLATTNVLTMDLAAVPLLWVLPMGVYFAAFALAFKTRPFCPEWLRKRFVLAAAVGLFLYLLGSRSFALPLFVFIPAHLAALFVMCLICNVALYRLRPETDRLGGYYLDLALGGFLGGALVSWVAPHVGASTLEYPAAVSLTALGLAMARPGQDQDRLLALSLFLRLAAVAALILAWPFAVKAAPESAGNLPAVAAALCLPLCLFGLHERPRRLAFVLTAAFLACFVADFAALDPAAFLKHRTYYGIYRVYDRDGKRFLLHGSTLHGSQYLAPARQKEALNYYHVTAPAGELLARDPFSFQRIGAIGLGAGSLAAYAKPGQEFTFFELDPYNKVVAETYFTFLHDAAAPIRLVFGDGRLSLREVQDNGLSALFVDAFNSDAIPIHLMTVEAFAEYRRVLSPDGVVLLHVSNKYLRLAEVVRANARTLGLNCLEKDNLQNPHPDANRCQWMALTASRATAERLVRELAWRDLSFRPAAVRPWTDQSSNLLEALAR